MTTSTTEQRGMAIVEMRAAIADLRDYANSITQKILDGELEKRPASSTLAPASMGITVGINVAANRLDTRLRELLEQQADAVMAREALSQ